MLRPSIPDKPVGLPSNVGKGEKSFPVQTSIETQGRMSNFLRNSYYPHLSSQATTLDGHILVPSEAISLNYSPTLTQGFMAIRNSSDLVKAKTDIFVTEERKAPGSNQKVLYLRAK